MKTILLSMAAVSAIALAAPAAAQYGNGGYQSQDGSYQYPNQNGAYANGNLSARIGQLQTRFQAGVQSGAISRSEAVPLRQQLRDLTRLERQYNRNGLTGQERADLQQRIRNLRQQLRAADGGGQGYGQYDRDDDYYRNGQYERDDRYGQNGQYSDRVDTNNDGYDDRDYNRNGRWDDDANGGYQQPAPRTGLGGIIDNVLGTGGLRVGQRASGNLYGVPPQYQNQYRDSSSSYYRSDGRQIYQIDARTNTVVRAYPMGQ